MHLRRVHDSGGLTLCWKLKPDLRADEHCATPLR